MTRDVIGVQEVLASAIARLRSRLAYLPRGYEDVQDLSKMLADALDIETNAEMYLEAARLEKLFGLWQSLICENLVGPDEGFGRYPASMHGTGSTAALVAGLASGKIVVEDTQREIFDNKFANLMGVFERSVTEGAPELVDTLNRERERNGPQTFYEMFRATWDEYEMDNLEDLFAGQKVLLVTDAFQNIDDFRKRVGEIRSLYGLLDRIEGSLTAEMTVPTWVIGAIVDGGSVAEAIRGSHDIWVDNVVFAIHDPLAGEAETVSAALPRRMCVPFKKFVNIDFGPGSIGECLKTDKWKWS